MNKQDLLVEIGLEEVPARFVTAAMEQLSDKVQKWLTKKAIPFGAVSVFSTPRRLAFYIQDVATAQADIEEEAKGPAKKIAQDAEGNWSKAAIGFTKGQGMTVDDIYFKEMNGVEYVHVNKFIKGQPTLQLLTELKEIITSLSFPKNMRWADQDLRFVRPIKWMVALFGGEVIPFEIAGVETGRMTKGHRFLGEAVEVITPDQYEKALEQQFVMADPEKRKQLILDQIHKLEVENGWQIPVDQDLLEEVNNLVEYPTALFGNFEEEFLELPQEVLITSMKEHQRYFPVKSKDGKLLPHFVTVRNGNADYLDNVAKGNEKVLRARLSDADFFYREDKKKEIASALEKLKSIVYHEEIGTLAEKTARVQKLTGILVDQVEISDQKELALRAAEIAKFDLVSHMVYEFPELQGYMGEKYALLKGEPKEVAAAINEHYMPRHAEDSVPPSSIGAVLSVAEKMDTIVSFFAIGVIPTGSQDPYALRRQASGVVQILLEKKWSVSLEKLLAYALDEMEARGIAKRDSAEISADLLQFFKARVKHLLTEKGIRYDLIDALLINEIGNVSALVERALVLEKEKDSSEFKKNIEALSRVMNIASKCEQKQTIDPALFENKEEAALFEKYQTVATKYSETDDEETHFHLLVSLQPEIEQYFEHTMVMAEQDSIRENRLSLMKEISELAESFASVNKILSL